MAAFFASMCVKLIAGANLKLRWSISLILENKL